MQDYEVESLAVSADQLQRALKARRAAWIRVCWGKACAGGGERSFGCLEEGSVDEVEGG